MRGRKPEPVYPRLLARSVETKDGCWEWHGGVTSGGYGSLSVNQRATRVHRAAYELFVGPIPEGLTIDHLCRNKRCWRPDHLDPVPGPVNTRRAVDSVSSINAAKTRCHKGHPFEGDNLIPRPLPNGTVGRDCRSCRTERARRNYLRRRKGAAA